MKDYFRELEQEPEDLIGHDETEVSEEQGRLMFNWKRREAKYRLVECMGNIYNPGRSIRLLR